MTIVLLICSRGAFIMAMAPDGNCLINAFVQHQNGSYDNVMVLRERQNIVKYMLEHSEDFQLTVDIASYENNAVFMGIEHITAWHNMREINVVLFEYDMDNDGLIERYWWNNEYANKDVCGLLFTKRIQGHYDYVIISIDEEPQQFQIQPHGHRNPNIILFDEQHQIPSINNHNNQNIA